MCRSLYLAGSAIKQKRYIDIAKDGFTAILQRNVEDWNLEGATFCHGYSGLLQMTNRMFIDTGDKIEPKSTWADFFRLVKTVISSKILLVLAIVLNALSSFVTLMIPLFTKELVDGFTKNAINIQSLLLMGMLFVLQAILSGLSIYLLCFLGQNITENHNFGEK